MSPRLTVMVVVLLGALLAALGSVFTVHQTQQALVLQFGEPRRVITEPGLHFNKIVDPLKFYQTVATDTAFRDRFGNILNGSVRDALGQADLTDVLGANRQMVMDQITEAVRRRAPEFGVAVIEVRIGRTELTTDTTQATYNRMRSDRMAEAADFRGRGQEQKSRIEAEANRERTVLIAEAEKQSQTLIGEGEALSRKILNDAQGKDAKFYAFFRSMEAYRASLGGGTTMVLSPDSEFFRYFDELPR
jgi:membrane protease subunit HflC